MTAPVIHNMLAFFLGDQVPGKVASIPVMVVSTQPLAVIAAFRSD
jgi:hypothetical protein